MPTNDGSSELGRRAFLGAGAVGAIALGLGLTGCVSSSSPSGATRKGPAFSGGPAGGVARRGGTLSVGLVTAGNAETIDARVATQPSDYARIFNLYDFMFTQKPGGEVGPGLIEQASPNSDSTVWNFRVRSGVQWHDGKPLTADDIVYTIKRSWGDPKNLFNAALALIVDFKNVRKVGPRDVRIPLKLGVAQFPSITCFPNCMVIQDGTTNFSNGNGTGPFKLTSFRPGTESVFVANKNYWQGGGPYVDTLIIKTSYNDEAPRMNALLSGQIDILPAASAPLLRGNANKIVIGNQPGPSFTGMVMQVGKGPLRDERVRKALKLIPDRQKYLDVVYDGYATVGNDVAGATDQYWASDLKGVHDPEQARSLLKRAGADNLQFNLLTSAILAGTNETATLFQQDARKAGLDVKLSRIDPSIYYTPAEGFLTRPFAMSGYNTGLASLAMFYVVSFLPGAPFNETGWGRSAKETAPIVDALRETDPGKATEKWHAAQQHQYDAGGYLIPANSNWLDAYSKRVRGIQTTKIFNCNNYDFAAAWLVK